MPGTWEWAAGWMWCETAMLLQGASVLELSPVHRKTANWSFLCVQPRRRDYGTLNTAFSLYLPPTHVLTQPVHIPLKMFKVLSWNPFQGKWDHRLREEASTHWATSLFSARKGKTNRLIHPQREIIKFCTWFTILLFNQQPWQLGDLLAQEFMMKWDLWTLGLSFSPVPQTVTMCLYRSSLSGGIHVIERC